MSLDNLCAALSAYSFFFPVSIHLSSGRAAPEPPAQVQRMLALLKKEIGRHLAHASQGDRAATGSTRQPEEEANALQAVEERSPARLGDDAVGATAAAVYRQREEHGRVAARPVAAKESLVAAVSALARLGAKSGDRLSWDLQSELCVLLEREMKTLDSRRHMHAVGRLEDSESVQNNHQGMTPTVTGRQPGNSILPPPASVNSSFLSSSSLSSSSLSSSSLSSSSLSSLAARGATRDATLLRLLQDCGTVAAALTTLRVVNRALVRLLVEEASACLDLLRETAERSGSDATSSAPPSSLSSLSPSTASGERKEQGIEEAKDASLISRVVQAVLRLCADAGHPAELLRASLWRLEQDRAFATFLTHAELLRLSSALCEEEVKRVLLRPASAGDESEHEAREGSRGDFYQQSQDPTETVEAVGREADVPHAFLFSLRCLSAFASASDEAFDTLSPRGLLLLLGSLSLSTKLLRRQFLLSSSPASSDSSSQPPRTLLRLLNTTLGRPAASPLTSPPSLSSSPSQSPSSASSSTSAFASSPCRLAACDVGESDGESETRAERAASRRGTVFSPGGHSAVARSASDGEGHTCVEDMKNVEKLLHEFAEALARAATARAVDCTPADVLLGLAALARLECHETTLPFSGDAWRPTPSFAFVADCFLRAMLRKWKSWKGRSLFSDAAQSECLLRLLEQLGLQEKAEPLYTTLKNGRGYRRASLARQSRPERREGTWILQSEETDSEQDDELCADHQRLGLGGGDRHASTERASAEAGRSLTRLERSSLPFLDDEDFGLSRASRAFQRKAEKRRGSLQTLRGCSDGSRTDESEGERRENEQDWKETLGSARPLVRDREQEGRLLSLLEESPALSAASRDRDCLASSLTLLSSAAPASPSPSSSRSRSQEGFLAPDGAFERESDFDGEDEATFSFKSLYSSSLLFPDEGLDSSFQSADPNSRRETRNAQRRELDKDTNRSKSESQARNGNDASERSKRHFAADGYVRDAQGRVREWWDVNEQSSSARSGNGNRRGQTNGRMRSSSAGTKGLSRAQSGRGAAPGTPSKQKYKARRQEDRQAAEAFFLHA
ncbi:conserved hypothetical protein [Neospora caninum Liverpool]|nr:conserved hypothetical protein [Neospora caninum Liverpool]CBZ54324.1 conserved hypothetical protein [Neospora caninum Liverpool]|eukprot:XP_003884355.1 conserved hypothetical protein [Neospora caninum Liverpool]